LFEELDPTQRALFFSGSFADSAIFV